jgi:peptide/nickel transport system substrate-binding protein
MMALAFVQFPTGWPAAMAQNNGLTEADTADAVSFHPYLTTDTASSSYQGLVYAAGLERRNPDTLELEPLMAKSWTISPDYLVYTFTLRSDLKWSDGVPITSEDFKWTFDQANDPANEYPYRENFDFIKSYEAPDPQTIVVTVKNKFCPALEGVDAVTPLPKHIWEKLDWKDPEKNPEIMHPSVSSGPFKLKEWVKDDHAIFEANDSYFLGRPKLDTYTIRIVPEQSVAYTMLQSGEVDTAPVTPDQFAATKKDPDLNEYDWWLARGAWSFIGFNLRHPVLQDVRVRHALSYAFNRNDIIDKVLHGLARPQYSTIVPSSPYYNPDVPRYDYNPDMARQLLKEAGYTPGPDGILQKDGQRLSLKLIYGPNTSKTREAISIVTQAQFKQVGVDVSIQGLEWGAFLDAQSKPPHDWDLTVAGWAATLDPHWMWQIWSPQFPELDYVNYSNPKVADLFTQGSTQCDNRKPIYDEIQRIIAEDSPYIFISQDQSYAFFNKRIGGIRPTTIGIGYNIEQWYVKSQ